MAYTLAHLEMAERHVREGRARVEDLELHIEYRHSHGWPTKEAERAFAAMGKTLDLMIDHRRLIAESVERSKQR